MSESVVEQKSKTFAFKIIRLYKQLAEEQHEYVLSKQILRSGTGIGANITEGEYAQSRADFFSKLGIALKEATETKYWLDLLFEGKYIDEKTYVE